MNVGDLVAGATVVWIGPKLNRHDSQDVAVRCQYCGLESTLKMGTMRSRVSEGKVPCHQCRKARNPPPRNFATGPTWPVPPSVLRKTESQ